MKLMHAFLAGTLFLAQTVPLSAHETNPEINQPKMLVYEELSEKDRDYFDTVMSYLDSFYEDPSRMHFEGAEDENLNALILSHQEAYQKDPLNTAALLMKDVSQIVPRPAIYENGVLIQEGYAHEEYRKAKTRVRTLNTQPENLIDVTHLNWEDIRIYYNDTSYVSFDASASLKIDQKKQIILGNSYFDITNLQKRGAFSFRILDQKQHISATGNQIVLKITFCIYLIRSTTQPIIQEVVLKHNID